MPIYEYKCQSCEKLIEVIQQMSDKPLKKCETCGGSLEKLLSRTGFVLKGGGWYADGYGGGKKGSGSSSASESSKESKPESKETKSETKAPAVKTKESSKSKGD
jgi:putative FmdB family regulatory protein